VLFLNPGRKPIELEDVALTIEERTWLHDKCPFFSESYLDFLSSFRFRPTEQVSITFVPKSDAEPDLGHIEIDIHGLWKDTILYEVPLMAALCDAFFRTEDTDWSNQGQEGGIRAFYSRTSSKGPGSDLGYIPHKNRRTARDFSTFVLE
jgi:nicotinic acid phosphoribosyltransferase